MFFKSVSVVGLGYIGLPTAAILASRNIKVIGLDVNIDIVNRINNGQIHIIEPGLEEIVEKSVKDGYLRATLEAEPADAFIIAVPTPFKKNKTQVPEPDLSFVFNAIESISSVLKRGDLLIIESTSPVGTTEEVSKLLSKLRPELTLPDNANDDSDISIAYCPERVMPGDVIKELVENDRVIGGLTPACSKKAEDLYKNFVKGNCLITNSRTAEMVKLTENSCRDVQIAFANELSMICDELDINVWELISLANHHPRINILQPGPGVGGHCIAVDPWFIVSKTPLLSRLIQTAREINDYKPSWVFNKINESIKSFININPNIAKRDIRITCFGLAFKANIDDLRESPAMQIALQLASETPCKIQAVEPNITKLDTKSIELVTLDFALMNTDIAVLLVDHEEFQHNESDFPIKIDLKGIWSCSKII